MWGGRNLRVRQQEFMPAAWSRSEIATSPMLNAPLIPFYFESFLLRIMLQN